MLLHGELQLEDDDEGASSGNRLVVSSGEAVRAETIDVGSAPWKEEPPAGG